MNPQQEQQLRMQARARGYDKAKEDAYVEFVRQKSAAPPPQTQPTAEQPKGDGFLKSLVKDPVKTLIVKPGVRAAQAGIALFGGEKGKQFAEKDYNINIPVLGDFNIPAQKSGVEGAKQVAADALSSATYLAAPTIPKAGPLASTAAKVATRGAKIAAGAASGYASDVASNLNQGKSGTDILKPGLGTAIGAGIPAIGGAIDVVKGLKGAAPSIKSNVTQSLVKKEVEKLAQKYDEVFTSTKAAKKGFVKSERAGKNPSRFLAERGDIIDIENGKINSQPVMQKVSQDADTLEEVFDGILQEKDRYLRADQYIPLNQLGARVKSRLASSSNKASGEMSNMNKEVDRLINEFKQQFGDQITLSQSNLIKRGQWKQSKVFDATRPAFSSDINYNFGRVAKDLIEDNIPEADIRMFNSILGDHYDALDSLRRIDGNAVKGGRLGGYFARTIGAVAGAKAGPLGSIVGAVTGDAVSNIMQANYIANPVKKLILARIPKESPAYAQAQQALQTLIKNNVGDFVKQPALPKPSFIPAGARTIEEKPMKILSADKSTGRDVGTGKFKRTFLSSGKEDKPITDQVKEFRSPLGTTFLPKVRKAAGRALDALNESTPGLSTKARKRTVTYKDQNGKTQVLKNLSMDDAKDWTAWLQRQGLKYTVKAAGTAAVGLAIAKNKD